jgi:bacillithiol system protein YtxJ
MTTSNLNEYHTIQSVDDIVSESNGQIVLLLKHSAICPTSFYAKNQIDEFVKLGKAKVFLLVVQEQRPLSNEIAAHFDVKHESPQLLAFQDSKVISNLSHHEITVAAAQKIVG